jgi:hypothetical protein
MKLVLNMITLKITSTNLFTAIIFIFHIFQLKKLSEIKEDTLIWYYTLLEKIYDFPLPYIKERRGERSMKC